MERVASQAESEQNREIAEYFKKEADVVLGDKNPSLENFARAVLRVSSLSGSERSYTGPELATAILAARNNILNLKMESRRIDHEDLREAFDWVPSSAGLRSACIKIMEKELEDEGAPKWEVFGQMMTALSFEELIRAVPETTVSFDGGRSFVNCASVREQLKDLKAELNEYFTSQNAGESEIMDRATVKEILNSHLSRLPEEGEFAVALRHTVTRLVLPAMPNS